MDETQPPDSESPTALIPKKRRRPPLFVKLLIMIAGLAAVAAFVVIQRSSNVYWYVSQPIDAQGRRVHILVPNGWTPQADTSFHGGWTKDTSGSRQSLTISPSFVEPKMTWLQRVMKMLHMASPEESPGVIDLHVDRDETGRQSDPNRDDSVETGPVKATGNGMAFIGYIARRTIPIRGTNMEATVDYRSMLLDASTPGAKQEVSDTAKTICKSMYVK